jgi:hypothetical protein
MGRGKRKEGSVPPGREQAGVTISYTREREIAGLCVREKASGHAVATEREEGGSGERVPGTGRGAKCE